MPIVPLFTASQIIGVPTNIIFEDTSTGSDVAIISRRIYLQTYTGGYLVPSGTLTSYIDWPLATNPISINVLTADTALSMVVQWLDVNGTVLYSKTGLSEFNMNAKMLNDQLISAQQVYPNKVNDVNYYMNRMWLTLAIDDAYNSIVDMSDITNSQQACIRGMYFVDNQNNLF